MKLIVQTYRAFCTCIILWFKDFQQKATENDTICIVVLSELKLPHQFISKAPVLKIVSVIGFHMIQFIDFHATGKL